MTCRRFLAAALLASAVAIPAQAESPRTIRFSYAVEIGPFTGGEQPAQIFLPLAQTDEHQRVISREITASIPGVVQREERHGNSFWYAELSEPDGKSVSVRVDYVIERRPWRREDLDRIPDDATLSPTELRQLQQYLDSDRLVPVNHPVLAPALEEIRRTAPIEDKAKTARAIYDWLVDNLEYKKVGTGWGNGDIYWACDKKRGNCTDFHALFIGFTRALGIPARFEIGFSVPTDRPAGEIAGYHCWAQFFLADKGWIPVDASEANKHPERREYFFGAHDANRVLFTVGRDLEFPGMQGEPLNFFIYPYAEVDGSSHDAVDHNVRYRDLQPPGNDGT